MNLSDKDLHFKIKELVKKERLLLSEVLEHLKEIDKRKLFSDYGCTSLFDYCVKELRYSESQACRRIQAMRLIREIPEVQEKVKSGKLSLSNIGHAQSFFRINKGVNKEKILNKLEEKSSREGQKILLSLSGGKPIPKERNRLLGEDLSQISFTMNKVLKEKLEELQSLLGKPMTFAELISYMADSTIKATKEKKFGKMLKSIPPTPKVSSKPRFISKTKKQLIWQKANSKCQKCGSKKFLQIDHIQPVALGGSNDLTNLRLLCFHCNQREAVKLGFQPAKYWLSPQISAKNQI